MKAKQTTTAPKKPSARARTAGTGKIPGAAVSPRADGVTRVSPAERRALIARAAYFRSERRHFTPGGELQDWLEAEAEIERLLGSS